MQFFSFHYAALLLLLYWMPCLGPLFMHVLIISLLLSIIYNREIIYFLHYVSLSFRLIFLDIKLLFRRYFICNLHFTRSIILWQCQMGRLSFQPHTFLCILLIWFYSGVTCIQKQLFFFRNPLSKGCLSIYLYHGLSYCLSICKVPGILLSNLSNQRKCWTRIQSMILFVFLKKNLLCRCLKYPPQFKSQWQHLTLSHQYLDEFPFYAW